MMYKCLSMHVLNKNIDKIQEDGVSIVVNGTGNRANITRKAIKDISSTTDSIDCVNKYNMSANISTNLSAAKLLLEENYVVDMGRNNICYSGDEDILSGIDKYDGFIASITFTPDRIIIYTDKLMVSDMCLLNAYIKGCVDKDYRDSISIQIIKGSAFEAYDSSYFRIEIDKFKHMENVDGVLFTTLDNMILLYDDFEFTPEMYDELSKLSNIIKIKSGNPHIYHSPCNKLIGVPQLFGDDAVLKITFSMDQDQRDKMDVSPILKWFKVSDSANFNIYTRGRNIFIRKSAFVEEVLRRHVYGHYSCRDAYYSTILEFIRSLQAYFDTVQNDTDKAILHKLFS